MSESSLSSARLSLTALDGIPEVTAGMALAPLIAAALERHALVAAEDDVLLVCQKIVSKSEDRFVELAAVEVSERARDLAARCGKDPRLVEVILRESIEVVRCVPQVLIVRHRLGLVMANAGVDQSNVPGSEQRVLLLPQDPDASAPHRRSSSRTPSAGRGGRVSVEPRSAHPESPRCSIGAASAIGPGASSR
jgi:coenzyme F420-0:L-glutamate ligase/coenzyme F420-1:gamma-L-glutamate ligase